MRWDVVERALPADPSTRVVEMGAGLGAFGARLASRYDRYQGVEPAADSAAVARARVEPFGGRVVPDLDQLDPGTAADLLCAFEVLEHIEEDRTALSRWAELLRPGGRVIVSVPAEPDRYGPWDERVGHYRRYSAEQLAGLFRDSGLRPVAVRHYGFPLGYALEVARNAIAARDAAAIRDVPIEQRTEGSGRQRQATSPLAGRLRHVLTRPFTTWQRHAPHRGPGLVGLATRP